MSNETTTPAHTAGPWSLIVGIDKQPLLYEDGQGLCVRAGKEGNSFYIRGVDREANARLIAAAPDLLEACIAALEEGDEHAAIQKLKAAISKATSLSA